MSGDLLINLKCKFRMLAPFGIRKIIAIVNEEQICMITTIHLLEESLDHRVVRPPQT